jgi:hypothetical protein
MVYMDQVPRFISINQDWAPKSQPTTQYQKPKTRVQKAARTAPYPAIDPTPTDLIVFIGTILLFMLNDFGTEDLLAQL